MKREREREITGVWGKEKSKKGGRKGERGWWW